MRRALAVARNGEVASAVVAKPEKEHVVRRIDQHSPEGKALQAAVQKKLREYLGESYSDEVLPLYIVVMMAHGTTEPVVAENLEAFLSTNAPAFTSWLFQHIGSMSKVEALKVSADAEKTLQGAAGAADTTAAEGTAEGAARQDARTEDGKVSLSTSDDDMSASTRDGDGQQPANADGDDTAQTQPSAAQQGQRQSDGQVHESSQPSRSGRQEGRLISRIERMPDRGRRNDYREWHAHDSRHEHDTRRRRSDGRREADYRRDHHSEYDRRPHDSQRGGRWDDYDRWHGSYGHRSWQPSFREEPYHDRHYSSHGYDRPRHRSLSPPRHGYRSSSGRYEWPNDGSYRHGAYRSGRRSSPHTEERSRMHRELRDRDTREQSAVPDEIDFEAKAQDIPAHYRPRPTSQLANPIQAQLRQQPLEQDYHAAGADVRHLRVASAPVDADMADAAAGAAAEAADDHWLPYQESAMYSQSLPAALQQQPSVFARLQQQSQAVALRGSASQQPVQQVPSQQQQQPGVFGRLGSSTAGNGNVFDRLAATRGQPSRQGRFSSTASPGPAAPSDDISTIRTQLQEMSSMLNQLRSAAQLEMAGRQPQPLQVLPGQGPADVRSITVTSVHPLALEHPAILRAHFGICGRIIRATVLRDRQTGMASGKAHIEYADVLAAQKALRLAHSLLLDRPVRVRPKLVKSRH